MIMKQDLESRVGIFGTDPDGLLAIVDRKLKPILEKEKAELERKQAIEKANQEKLAAQRAKEEAAQRKKEQRQVSSFRKSIKEGDDSNCGPVLEVKSKLIKVAFPVESYGNEHWVKRNEIFPAGYQCQFVNGQYIPPQ